MEMLLNMLCTNSLQRRMLKVHVQSPGKLQEVQVLLMAQEPGLVFGGWLWDVSQLSYFFPPAPHEPYLLLVPKSPPLHVSGLSRILGLNAHGVNCRAGIHNIEKKNFSHWDLSWQPEGWEMWRDAEGSWNVWHAQGNGQGQGCSLMS